MRSLSFGVTKQDARAAIRVGASVGLPLFAVYAWGDLHFAVFAAFGALTSLYGHSESAGRRLETQLAAGAAMVITVAAAAAYASGEGPIWLLGVMLFLLVICTGSLGTVMGWVPRGEIFFILVLLVIAGIPLRPEDLPLAIAISAGGALFSMLLTLPEARKEAAPRPVAERLRLRAATGASALDLRQHVIIIGCAAVGVVGAWLLALALQMGHPFWAPITVAALIPALVSADAVRRTAQLAAGTLGGVGFAALLFLPAPGPLALIAIIAICQAIAELFVARSYAVALLFISPLAIGMSNLGRGLPWPPLLIDRLIEAGLGTSVALATILIGRAILARTATPQDGAAGRMHRS